MIEDRPIRKRSGPVGIERPAGVRALVLGLLCLVCSLSASAATPSSDYRLQFRDKIEVKVFNEPELSATCTIDSTGEISLPPLKSSVALAGKTLAEARQILEARYRDEKILLQPQVNVDIVAHAPLTVQVTGEVQRQGMLTFPAERITLELSEVIALSGGFTELAKESTIEIFHVDEHGNETRRVVKYKDATRPGHERVILFPGDRIHINRSIT